MKFFAGNSMWELIRQSDALSCLVLLILLGMSIFCWAIAVYAWRRIKKISIELEQALLRLAAVASLEQLTVIGQTLSQKVPGILINHALVRSRKLLEEHQGLKKQLSSHDVEILRNEVDSLMNELMIREEQALPFLKTCAEVGPLLGLFGTVWGLIHAFVRISQEQNADIVTVAPGIAEALITTLVGLIVAIPALVLFHFLQTRVHYIEHQLMLIADRCLWVIQTTLQNRE